MILENEYIVVFAFQLLTLFRSATMNDCLSISNNLILNRMHSKYVRVCVFYVDFAVVIVCVRDKLINYSQHC